MSCFKGKYIIESTKTLTAKIMNDCRSKFYCKLLYCKAAIISCDSNTATMPKHNAHHYFNLIACVYKLHEAIAIPANEMVIIPVNMGLYKQAIKYSANCVAK